MRMVVRRHLYSCILKEGTHDKHARTCRYQSFEFPLFVFSSLGSFGLEAEELPSHLSMLHL